MDVHIKQSCFDSLTWCPSAPKTANTILLFLEFRCASSKPAFGRSTIRHHIQRPELVLLEAQFRQKPTLLWTNQVSLFSRTTNGLRSYVVLINFCQSLQFISSSRLTAMYSWQWNNISISIFISIQPLQQNNIQKFSKQFYG